MSESKTPISGASSYVGIGEYWDKHDLNDHWEQTSPAEFDVDLRSSSIYFPIERTLVERLRRAADAQGVPPDTLLNLWIQHVTEELVIERHSITLSSSVEHGHLDHISRSTIGGVVTLAAGVVWEILEVAHNLNYLLANSSLDWRTLLTLMWQSSPLALLSVGLAWVVTSLHLRRKPERKSEVASRIVG
jgi:hypothetical protein